MQRSDPYPQPDAVAIRKRFVRVGAHRVHYRVIGTGPAIVLLHDSPRSSRLHLETMHRLSSRFQVYALDTPGYGNSSPIGIENPTIADFGRLLGDTLRALGLGRAPLYATHTSAKIALDHAVNAAAPPAMLLLDGLSLPEHAPDEAFIAAYMRPFRIDPTGAYLAAEWSRMQDMLRWFPWFDQRPANRIAMDRPNDAWIDDYVIDLLSAGPHYADAYAAAMRYDPRAALRRVACPTVVGARSDDVLFGCLDLLPADTSKSVRVARLSPDRDAWLTWIAETLADGAIPTAPPSTSGVEDGPIYVDLPHGQMLVHRMGPAGTAPLLLIEAPTTLHARLWQAALASDRCTLVPELPGYGESDPLPVGASLDAYADVVAEAAQTLAIDTLEVLAIGAAAAAIAMTLAARHPALVRQLAFDGIADAAADQLCPAIVRDQAGGHLHRIWHMLRDGELQSPWFDGRITAQHTLTPCLAAEPLHRALVDILKQPAHYADAVRAADRAGLAIPAQPALFFALDDDAGYAGVGALAARFAAAEVVARPADIASAARFLRAETQSARLSRALEPC